MPNQEKRYVVTVDMYVYADSDYLARKRSHDITDSLKEKYDNRASIIEIGEQPHASMNYRRLEDFSKPVTKERKVKPLPF
tara:strand:- start:1337 stop:1576 length:240 start_codon:yes stop_codon:yes gene_type:complete